MNARIPDLYGGDTTCLHQRGRTVLNSDGVGNIDFIWIGHPTLAARMIIAPSSTNLAQIGSCGIYSATTPTNLAAKFSTYRTVANGISIENLQPALSAAGRFYMARVPMSKTFWDYDTLAAASPTGSLVLPKLCGISSEATTFYVPNAICNLPEYKEYTVSDLMRNKVYANNKPMAPSAFEFVSSYNSVAYNSTLSYGEHVEDTTSTGVITRMATMDSQDLEGWSVILIRGFGFPNSTPVLLVDTMIHMEGIPIIDTTEAASFVPSSAVVRATRGALDTALDYASRVPWSKIVEVASTGIANYGRKSLRGRLLQNGEY